MKVKQIIRYYFLSAEAERRIERLILKKACKAFDARSAEDCVAEVVALTIKRQRLRELNSLLSRRTEWSYIGTPFRALQRMRASGRTDWQRRLQGAYAAIRRSTPRA